MRCFKSRALQCLWVLSLVLAWPLFAQATPPTSDSSAPEPLGDEIAELSIEALKQKVVELNRDLLILEEELLFPASTQISVFVSTDTGEYFLLDSLRVEIDGQLVASHLYTERERLALKQGGIQRLYLGNIKSGEHELLAVFTGKGPNNREYKRALTVTIDKKLDPILLELHINDANEKLQPRFESQQWQVF